MVKITKIEDLGIEVRLVNHKTDEKIAKIDEQFEQDQKLYKDNLSKMLKIKEKRDKQVEKLNLNRDKKLKKLEDKMAKLKMTKEGLKQVEEEPKEAPVEEVQQPQAQAPIQQPQMAQAPVQEQMPQPQQVYPQPQMAMPAQVPQEQMPQPQYEQPYVQQPVQQPQQQVPQPIQITINMISGEQIAITTDTNEYTNTIEHIKTCISDNVPLEIGDKIINSRHILHIE